MSEQHVNATFLRPFLDVTDQRFGNTRTDDILRAAGVTRTQVWDDTEWVSLQTCEELCASFHEAFQDPAFFEQIGQLSFQRKYLGIMRPIIQASNSPRFVYKGMLSNIARFNKVGIFEVIDEGPCLLDLRYRPKPDAPTEREGLICAARRGQISAIPTLFGLPPAEVEHDACLSSGDPHCHYRITWRPPVSRWRPLLGFTAGGAFGFAIAIGLGAPTSVGLLACAGFAIAGQFVGRSSQIAEKLRISQQHLDEARGGLIRAAHAHEHQYTALVDAKHDVERQVEERTRELDERRAQLAESLDRIWTLDQERRAFFDNISHELRTPLSTILALLDTPQDGSQPDLTNQELLDSLRRNSMRQLELVNQLLQIARTDAGAVDLQSIPIDLGELARSVHEAYVTSARLRGVTLEVDSAPETPLILGDPPWLVSAIGNLVTNAIKACASGDTVRIVVGHDNEGLSLEVSDDGPGIPEAFLPRIFDRFSQAGDAEARKGGSGLGLAIVHEAVRLHEGDISVISSRETGTRFNIRLPRPDSVITDDSRSSLQPFLKALPQTPHTPNATSRTPTPISLADADAPLVLVVENDPDLLQYLIDILGHRCRVMAAVDGVEAQAVIAKHLPDLVLTDVQMPRCSGLELVETLRAHERTREVPVIMLTAQQRMDDVVRCYEAGANDYVRKPFHLRELLVRVDVQLRMSALRRQIAHRERLSAIGTLAAEVAHQARNPLNVILSGLEMLDNLGTLDASLDDQQALFDALKDCGERLAALVDDLVNLSGMDRGARSVFDPQEGLKTAQRLISTAANGKVQLSADLGPSVEIEGYAGALNHVFYNLLDNAVRAAGPGGKVKVRSRLSDDGVVIEVGDNGAGVPEVDLGRLFEPFYTTRPAGKGTGLGLSIARDIVAEHGGSIRVDDDPELGGARFTVRLPSCAPAAAELR